MCKARAALHCAHAIQAKNVSLSLKLLHDRQSEPGLACQYQMCSRVVSGINEAEGGGLDLDG